MKINARLTLGAAAAALLASCATMESDRDLFNRADTNKDGQLSLAEVNKAGLPRLFSIFDVDGNGYLDYALAWGPLILGHAPPQVVAAVSERLQKGFTFGAQHDLEFEVAELLTRTIPCAEKVAFSNSGTEIVQVALRLARGVTGRPRHLKFEGHYHGWDDSVLVSYRPTRDAIAAAGGQPISVGQGQRSHSDVIVVEWNDREGVERAFHEHQGEIASLLCEPLLCNSGCLPPDAGFLDFLREITRANGTLLIFDEVITGYRLRLGGAQEFYGVVPDLATYAKAVGGGFPLSVLAGSEAVMNRIADGTTVHAGTLNGNPLALAAAQATLLTLAAHDGAVYEQLWTRGERLRLGIERALRSAGHRVVTSGGGPVFHVSFMDKPARTYRDTLAADTAAYAEFAMALLDGGILVLPDGRWYLSTAHTEADIDATLAVVDRAVQ